MTTNNDGGQDWKKKAKGVWSRLLLALGVKNVAESPRVSNIKPLEEMRKDTDRIMEAMELSSRRYWASIEKAVAAKVLAQGESSGVIPQRDPRKS